MSAPSANPQIAVVREVRHEVRIDLTDAPKLTNVTGRSRKPRGLRLTYGLRRDIARVDIAVEYEDDAELWPPAAEMPGWLAQVVQDYRPRDVDDPNSWRPTGMGGWAVDGAKTGGAS